MSSHRGRPAYAEDYDETTGTVDRDNRQVTSTKKSKRHRESHKPSYVEDYDETTGTVDRDNRQVTSTKKSKRHRESRKPRISFSDAQYPGESSSKDAPAAEEEKPVRVEGCMSFGSDDTWGSDPGSASYSCGETPPLRPNRASSENLDQDTLKLSMSQENAHTAPDTTSRFAARLYRKFKGDSSSRSGLPPSSDENKLTSLNPSNINWGGTVVLGSVKETFVSTPPRPTIIWAPTTVLGTINSPPLGALGTSPSQDSDSDNWSTRATEGPPQESIKIRRRRRPRKLPVALKEKRARPEPAPEPPAPSTSWPQSEPAPLLQWRNESQKQKSQGAKFPRIPNSELLEVAENLEQTPLRSGDSKRETEVDEWIQQQRDENRGPLVVPTVSNKKRWAGFDVDGHEHRGGSMGNAEPGFETPTAKYRGDREDMLTPDGITYSTPLNSEDGDSDDDDAVLHPKASGIRDLGGKIADMTSLQDKVTPDLTAEHVARNERADAYGGVPRPYVPDVPRLVPAAPVFNPFSSVAAAYQAGKEDADAERYGTAERIVERPVERIIERVIEQPRHVPVISHRRPEPRYAEPRFDDRYVDDLRREEDFLRHRDAEEYIEGRPAEITRLATILKSKQHWTNQHELAQDKRAEQSQPGTVSIATAFKGQATDMLDESPKLPQYVRENEFQGLFTPSYLPLLDSPSSNERRSRPIEDERDSGLLLDDEPLPLPPFYRTLRSENQRRRKRQASLTPSVESLQSLVDSVFSLASLSSASTASGSDNAFQRVLAVLQADAVLKDLYAALTARTSAVKFKRNLGILLKRFAVDLENESSCYDEQRTAKYIRSRARKLAQRIVDAVYPIERDQTSASLAQTRAESSEDSRTNDEPDEYLELEKFVTNSRSFQQLRDNIRGVLGLELSKLLAELPFAAENQLVESEESINSGQNALSCAKNVWSKRNFHDKIRDFLFPEPPIPNGLWRVRWKCPCGETLYDDYQELKPGAAKRMEDYLRRSSYKRCAGEPKSLTERISKVWSSFKNLNTFVTQWTGTLKDNGKTTIVNTELRYYSDARTTRTPAHTSGEVFYLLLCHNSGVGAEVVKLRQPDICDINNDQKLFSFLHEEYLALRKRWWTWISLWTLQSIKFVRFELYENELVDVKKLDDVPPPTKDNEYRHGPPNPPELNPPLGSTLLMHLFKHPEVAGTKKKCLQKIPRKLRNRLVVLDADDDATGWGLQFIEGWSKKRLMYMTALTFGLSSVVVMFLVSILGHDVQNAGAIASFILSFVTIGIATVQAAMHMN